jgi:hypothetical protein
MSLSDCALHSLSRLKWYHIFSWSVGLVMALLLSTVKGINGFWYVDEDVDTTAICWIKSSQSQGSVVNWRTFLFLYVPLVVVYVYCCRVLSGAYSHLRKGISKTFQHRVRVLVMNSINIGIYMTYWAVLGVLYAFAYAFSGSNEVVSRWFWRLVMFIISSKGFADLLVFILVSEASVLPGSGEGGGDSESMDVNGALRQEVLHYSTTGIRECAARKVDSPRKRKLVLLMTQKNIPLQNILTLQHLLRLVFSADAITSQHRSSTEEPTVADEAASAQMAVDVELLDEDDARSSMASNSGQQRKRRSTLARKLALPADLEASSAVGISPETSTPDSYIMGWEEEDGVSNAAASRNERNSGFLNRVWSGASNKTERSSQHEKEIGLSKSSSMSSEEKAKAGADPAHTGGTEVDDPEVGERGPEQTTRDTVDYAGKLRVESFGSGCGRVLIVR